MTLGALGLVSILVLRRKDSFKLKSRKNMNRLFLSFPALLLISSGLIHSQSTVSTPIVGFQKVSVPTGLSTAGFPLLNADVVKTAVTSVSGNSVALSGESNLGGKLTSGEPYYIEVYSGALKGDRFDVNTDATITAANGNVVLDSASANNTYSVASIASQLDGATIALRKHITIEQVQSMSSTPLVGNNSAAAADQIQFYDNSSSSYIGYFLRGDGVTWRKVGTTATANKTPVPPGTGVFISKQGSAVELTTTGTVRQNDFAQPYAIGLQLKAPAFPLEISPTAIGATAVNGWNGNNSAAAADQIQVYNPTTSAYDGYFLRGDGTTWRKVGTTTTVTTSNIATSGQGYFVSRNTANDESIIVNPVSP
jgi:hypothetical protein